MFETVKALCSIDRHSARFKLILPVAGAYCNKDLPSKILPWHNEDHYYKSVEEAEP